MVPVGPARRHRIGRPRRRDALQPGVAVPARRAHVAGTDAGAGSRPDVATRARALAGPAAVRRDARRDRAGPAAGSARGWRQPAHGVPRIPRGPLEPSTRSTRWPCSTCSTRRSPPGRRTSCPSPVSSSAPTSRCWRTSRSRTVPSTRPRSWHPGRTAGRPGGSSRQLARRLDLDVLGGVDPDECDDETLLRGIAARSRGGYDELADAGPHGVSAPDAYGWVHERVLPDGRWRLAPDEMVHDSARSEIPGPSWCWRRGAGSGP